MAKGRDNRGREEKKKKKQKKQLALDAQGVSVNLRHHTVVQEPPRSSD